jgi:hypothetical protein
MVPNKNCSNMHKRSLPRVNAEKEEAPEMEISEIKWQQLNFNFLTQFWTKKVA